MKRIDLSGRRGIWLIALGAVMLTVSLIMLFRIDEVAQYIAPLPAAAASNEEDGETTAESALQKAIKDWQTARVEFLDANGMCAFSNERDFLSPSSNAAGTLFAVDAGWLNVHPRYLKSGRLFSTDEYAECKMVAVLDEQMAFALFGGEDPIGKKVNIGGEWFEIVGIARHRRTPGDRDSYGLYIPINTAAKMKMQLDYVLMECVEGSGGTPRALQAAAPDIVPGGSYSLVSKEVMRVTMIVRIVAVVIGLYLLIAALKAWYRRTVRLIVGWQEDILHKYLRNILPNIVLGSLVQLLIFAAIMGAAYMVLTLTIRPMYVFTEWIPEVLVEWSSISRRFTELITDAAAPVSYYTAQYHTIRFWGAFTRWGMICLIMGIMLFKRWSIKLTDKNTDQ